MMVRIVLLCFSYYFQSWNGSPFQKLGGWSTGEPVWKGALSTWASSILFRQSIFRIAPHVVANSASTIAAMSAGPRARWDGGWGRVMGCGGWWWLGVARPNDGLTKPWCLRLGSGTRDRRRGVQLHLMRKWLWAQQVGEIPRSCYLSTTHKLLETTSLVFLKINVAVSTKTPKFFATTAGRLCHGCTSFLSHVPYIPHHFFVLYQSLFSSLDFTFSLIGYPCGVCSCQLPQGNSSHSAAVLSRFLLKTQTVTRSWTLLRGDFIPSVKHSKTLSLLRMNHVCSWYHVIYKSGWEKFTMRNPEFCGHLGMIPWILIVIPLMRIHLDKFHDISITIA